MSNSINGISFTDENGRLHPHWQEASREELLNALTFQGCVSRDLFKAEKEVDALKATIQAAIGVIDNWKVPLLDPDGKDSSESVMRLLADDLRKVLEDEQ